MIYSLNRPILVTIGVLYSGAAFLFFIDYMHWLGVITQIEDPFFGEYFTGYGTLKSYARTSLFLAGTLTAECYLIWSYRQSKDR